MSSDQYGEENLWTGHPGISLADCVQRLKALEEWKKEVDRRFAAMAPGGYPNNLIGKAGVRRAYVNVFEEKLDDTRDVSDVVRYFFGTMNHDERVRVLAGAGVIVSPIANDPVYYVAAISDIKEDREQVFRLYEFMYRAWTEHEAMALIAGSLVCKCGTKVDVNAQLLERWQECVREFDGNAEVHCFKCGNRLAVWDGYCWVAYLPGWSVKLDGLVKRKDYVIEVEHVCEMCERTNRTKQRWDDRWLCDWCHMLAEKTKRDGVSGFWISVDDAIHVYNDHVDAAIDELVRFGAPKKDVRSSILKALKNAENDLRGLVRQNNCGDEKRG